VLDVHPRTDVTLEKWIQFCDHCSNDFAFRAFSMFWFSCRTTLALYR